MVGEVAIHPVSEALSNVVENLACRIARKAGGRVTPGQLLPFAPMSLGLITACLDGMVNEEAVFRDDRDGEVGYLFCAYEGEPQEEALQFESCVSCGSDLGQGGRVLCASCEETVNRELRHLAQTTGWPAQAAYEHEFFHLAANHDGPLRAEDLAGRSRHTLRDVRARLKALTVQGFIGQDLDAESGIITYRFPLTEYSAEQLRRNQQQIRSYPASLEEELELKAVRICVALALLLLALFVLAFMHVPFPILVVALVVAAPIIAIRILKHRSRVAAD